MSAHDVPLLRDDGAGVYTPARPRFEPELLPCRAQRSACSSSSRLVRWRNADALLLVKARGAGLMVRPSAVIQALLGAQTLGADPAEARAILVGPRTETDMIVKADLVPAPVVWPFHPAASPEALTRTVASAQVGLAETSRPDLKAAAPFYIMCLRKLGVPIQDCKVMITTAFTREIGVAGLPVHLVPAAAWLYNQSQNYTLPLIANGRRCFFESFRTQDQD